MVELARYIIFEKKLPIFNYLPEQLTKKYIESYFMMQEMILSLKERNLMINYFQAISERAPCGENALWHLIDFGGYSEHPVIDIILQ